MHVIKKTTHNMELRRFPKQLKSDFPYVLWKILDLILQISRSLALSINDKKLFKKTKLEIFCSQTKLQYEDNLRGIM